MSRNLRSLAYLAWGVVVLVTALLALLYTNPQWFGRTGEAVVAGTAQIGGPFTLVDQNRQPITDQDLLGKPTAIFFGFTHCPDACPTTLLEMSERLKELGPDADKFNVLFVSLDPERDTPELLKVYLESFDPRIRAATGTPDAVADMAKKYRAFYRKVGEGDSYTLDHSTAVYLMNARGELVTLIDYKEDKAAALAKMKRALASS